MRKKASLLLLLLLLLGIYPLSHYVQPYLKERLPDTFSVEKIAMDLESDYPDLLPAHSDLFKDQIFYYLSHGVETVAFASQDEPLVIKFFLQRSMHGERRYCLPNLAHLWPPHRKKSIERRAGIYRKALLNTLRNYHVALEKLGEKTGIIALHLNASQSKELGEITVIDGQGKEHRIDLDRACFAVQKKVTLFPQKMASLKNTEEKLAALLALKNYLTARAQEGFVDGEKELMLETNYGFFGDEPIGFDIGKLQYCEGSSEQEIARMSELLNQWAAKHDLPTP